MAGEERGRAFEAFVAGRSAALLRTAYLVTGDEGDAQQLLRDALATTYLQWRRIEEREGVEEYVRRVMLTAHVTGQRPAPAPSPGPPLLEVRERIWAALRELTPRERAVLVLASRDQLDDDEIARVLTCSRRVVQADGTHAALIVRGALARPIGSGPSDAANLGEHQLEASAEPTTTMAGLDAAIRTTLAARADDVRPELSLADDARDAADTLRSRRRTRRLVGGGVAVAVIGCVLGLAALTASLGDDPSAVPSVSPSPSADQVPDPSVSGVPVIEEQVPPVVYRMAAESGALVAVGHTIIDGTSSLEIPVDVQLDPDSGAAVVQTIDALARVDGGYVVLTGPYRRGALSGDRVLYLDRRGNVTPLGMSAFAYGLAVSPDGLLVAFAEARAVGKPGMVAVRELSGQVLARREMEAVSTPVWLDREGVWVSPQVDPGSSPSYWNLATSAVDPLNVPTTEVLQTAHGPQLILDDFVGDGCTHALRVPSPHVPHELWSDCNVGTVRYSPTGELVAMVMMAPDTDVTVLTVRDSAAGQAVAQGALLDRPLIDDLRWTADGQYVTATASDSSEGERSILTFRVDADSRRLAVTRYPLTDDTAVVLGAELPLPPGTP